MAAIIDFSLIMDLALIIFVATIISYIAALLRQPSLIGYIGAGILIGPVGLGALNLMVGGIPFGITNISEIALFSELGVALMLFYVGVESDLRKLFEIGSTLIFGTVLQVLITAATVFLVAHFFGIFSFTEAVYLGVILAFSSTMIVVKKLSDEREINTLHGRLMIGFLLVQDFLVILALPVLANIDKAMELSSIALVVLQAGLLILAAVVLGKAVFPRMFSFAAKSDERLFLTTLSSCFIFILIAHLLNFSWAVGAFIGGLSLSTLPYSLEAMHKIRALRDFFATIFFVSLGMQISLEFLSIPLLLILVLVGVVFVLKPILFFAITLLSGYGGRVSMIVGMSMAQVSEFSFIIASTGFAAGILTQTPGLYSAIIVVIALSMAVTPYIMTYSNRIYEEFNARFGRSLDAIKKNRSLHRRISALERVPTGLAQHIVIFGGGTMGYNIAKTLGKLHSLVVVDHDSEIVFKCIDNGINSVYGSADNDEVFEKVNLHKAKMLIISTPFSKDAKALIKETKKINRDIVVFARAHYYKDALELYKAGADYVLMPLVLGSNLAIEKITNILEGNSGRLNILRDEMLTYLMEKVREEKKGVRF